MKLWATWELIVLAIGEAFHRAFMHRRMLVRLALIILAIPASTEQPSFAQASKANWVSGSAAENFWNQLSQSAYTQNGDHGVIVYMISYSTCGNCIAFLRDFWETRKNDMQLREIFAPINQGHLLDEAADMTLTRSAANADAYYHRTRIAPPANTPERQAALLRAERFQTQINQFLRQAGHIQDGFPTFIYRTHDAAGDKINIVSGWGDPHQAKDLDLLIQQAAQQR